jgi:hypothetical protein
MMAMMARGYTGPRRGPGAAAYIVGPHFGRGANPASDEAKARAAYPRALELLGQPPAALAQVDMSQRGTAAPTPQAAAAPHANVAERIRSGIVTALLAHGGQMNPQTLLNVALNARRAG